MKKKLPSFIGGLLLVLAVPVAAETFVINSLDFLPDLNPGDGVCDAGDGRCTLWAAYEESEASPLVRDTIDASGVAGTTRFFEPLLFTSPFDYVGTLDFIIEHCDCNEGYLTVDASTSSITGLHYRFGRGVTLAGNDITLQESVITAGQGLSITGERAIVRDNRLFDIFGTNAISDFPTRNDPAAIPEGSIIENNVIGLDLDDQPVPNEDSSVGIALNSDSQVLSNRIYASPRTLYGIHHVAGVGNPLLDSNEIVLIPDGRALAGILSRGPSAATYSNNRIVGLSNAEPELGLQPAGILLLASNDKTITGAEITGGEYPAMRVFRSDNVVVAASRFDDNSAGMVADELSSVSLYGNSISNNTGLGIDLGESGVQPNGPDDAFTDYPEIGNAAAGLQLSVSGNQTGLPGELITLEFFESAVCDDSGYGEGERFLGSTDIVLDETGNAPFSTMIDVVATPGAVLTSTATGDLGTSEFSECVVMGDARPPVVDVEFVRLNAWVLNPRSHKRLIGYFPSTESQTPADVDIDSLRLGDASALRSKQIDVDRDGDLDLVVSFRAKDTGASCGTAALTLTGTAKDTEFSFTEAAKIRPCWPPAAEPGSHDSSCEGRKHKNRFRAALKKLRNRH